MIKPELGIASTKPVLNWMIKTLKMIHFCFNMYSVSGRGAVGCGFLLDVGKEIRQDDTRGSFQPSELNLRRVHFFLTLYSPLFVLLVLFYFVCVLFLTCCCPVFLQWASSVSAACTSFLWVFSGQPDGDKKQTYQCHYVPAPFSSTGPFQKNTWELSRKLQPALWHDRRRSRMQCWGFCGKYFVLEKVYPNSIHNSYPISYILTLSYNSIHFQKRGKN